MKIEYQKNLPRLSIFFWKQFFQLSDKQSHRVYYTESKTKKYYLVDKLPVKFVLQIAFWLLIVVFLIFIYWSESDCWNASHSGLKKCLGARSDYLSEINNSKLLIFFWISYSPVQNNGCHGSVNFLCFNSIAIEKSLNILL